MFSPFNKDLNDLEAEDLNVLTEVEEGWYVEYKGQLTKAKSIAKSVSAFGNTYGGWLFFGVAERSKTEPVAGSFPGLPRDQMSAALQTIRQAVATLTAPSPHYDPKVVWGPCSLIGLPDDHGVICIRVPQSKSAPHVHRDGVIYRRVADSADPAPENDRFLLDQLWKRADGMRDYYKRWVNKDPDFSEAEQERPYLRLLLVADPWGDRDPWAELSLEDVRNIMGLTDGVAGYMPFDNVYTSPLGFIARLNKDNDPQQLGVTWKLQQNLVSEIIIPLNLHSRFEPSSLRKDLEGYDNATQFIQAIKTQGFRRPRVVDLNFVFNAMIGIAEIQSRFFKRAGWTQEYYFKCRLLNVWRVCPFVDVSWVISEFETHGTPVCLDRMISQPPGTSPETFIELPTFDHIEDEYARIVTHALHLFDPVARAFGIPTWIDREPTSEGIPYFEELRLAGKRALENQRLRNERLSTSS